MNLPSVDCLICGGGIVGLAAAAAFARQGRSVRLIDAQPAPEPALNSEFALRVSTLNLASVRILGALDAWREVLARRAYGFDQMHVWDAGGAGSIHFDAASLREPVLGYVAENEVVQVALIEALRLSDCVTLSFDARPTLVSFDEGVTCTLESGEEIRARLLVGADGQHSWVRRQVGLQASDSDYGQRAIVCNVATERSHENTAWQRFLPTGPVAFLPLAANVCSIVWSVRSEVCEELLALDDAEFEERLGEALARRLGTLRLLSGRAAFPLRKQHAASYVAPRAALIGDAAHTIHPLAGQGVNIGLLDAAALSESLAAHADPGEWRGLRRYERWRRGENALVQWTMDGFHHLFTSPVYGVRWARNAGLVLTDLCTPAKALLARRALGVSGALPELARTI